MLVDGCKLCTSNNLVNNSEFEIHNKRFQVRFSSPPQEIRVTTSRYACSLVFFYYLLNNYWNTLQVHGIVPCVSPMIHSAQVFSPPHLKILEKISRFCRVHLRFRLSSGSVSSRLGTCMIWIKSRNLRVWNKALSGVLRPHGSKLNVNTVAQLRVCIGIQILLKLFQYYHFDSLLLQISLILGPSIGSTLSV